MGTSTSNKGTRGKDTPLVPTWLYSDTEVPASPPTEEADGTPQSSPAPTPPDYPSIPSAGDANRFRTERSNFSRFARSGGTDHGSLKRAISGYIRKTSGGSTNAAKGMGSSRKAAASLLGFLSDVKERGIEPVLLSLNLESLAGQPVDEIFAGIRDYVCPEGGTVDAGIAIDSFIRTIADLAEAGISDFNTLSTDQIQTVLELYMTHTIEERIYNEIGTNTISLPEDPAEVEKVQEQVRDFISNGVSDALSSSKEKLENLSQDKMLQFVDDIYKTSYDLLLAFADKK